MRYVIVFITCLAHGQCKVTYPAPYMDFTTPHECARMADLFKIPAFQEPNRQITCMSENKTIAGAD